MLGEGNERKRFCQDERFVNPSIGSVEIDAANVIDSMMIWQTVLDVAGFNDTGPPKELMPPTHPE